LAGKFVPPVWNAPSKKSQEENSFDQENSDGEEAVQGREERNVGKLGRPNLLEDDVTETFEYAGRVVTKKNLISTKNDSPSHDEVATDDQLDSLEKQLTHLRDDFAGIENRSEPEPTSLSSASAENPLLVAPAEDVPQQSKKKRRVLLITHLLAIIVIAAVLAIVLGGKKSDENAANIAVGTGREKNIILSTSPTTTYFDASSGGGTYENATNMSDGGVPLLHPSRSPTSYCPVSTKLFSIQYKTVKEEITGADSYPMTWVLKESCTDNEIAKCQPCTDQGNASVATSSSPSSSVLFNNSAPNPAIASPSSSTHSPTMSATVQPFVGLEKYTTNSDGVSGCIPNGYEYVFEAITSDNAEECCGFLPYSFTMSHDNNVVTDEILIWYEFDGSRARVPFSENVESCQTSDPSSMPSAAPSEALTRVPTVRLTIPPTFLILIPSTSIPTAKIIQLTNPPSFGISEPVAVINGNPSESPTETPSLNPSENPSEDPSSNPTENPSEDPSSNPTENPSEGPSSKPSGNPSENPSVNPSSNASELPSVNPSENPSGNPSSNPSSVMIIFDPDPFRRRLSKVTEV
jgi:hypothetical protein